MGFSTSATAQAEGQRAGAPALEEVLVTATRREQNLQDVPLSIVAFSEEALALNNIENMEDLNAVVPNVLIRGGAFGTTGTNINMRGIPNVGTYIDGVWQVSGAGLLMREFVDVERIEVLRGPQGTLYGRDSTGGSIHVFTRPPGDEFGAQIDVGLGSYDRQDVEARLNIPITDKFRTRWTVGSYDHGGFVTSQVTGIKSGSFEDDVVRGDLYWTPTDRLSFRLTRQEDEIVMTHPRVNTWIEPQVAYNLGWQVGIAEAYDIASGGRFNNVTQASGYAGGNVGKYENRSETRTPSRQWLEQTTFNVDFDITDKISFKYIHGATDVDDRNYLDWDASEFNFYVDYDLGKTELDSDEIQISGGNDRFTWVGGLYQWNQTFRLRDTEWSMGDWIGVHPEYGQPQVLNYNNVLSSASCQMTPADRGVTRPNNQWAVPCSTPFPPFQMGWVSAFAGSVHDIFLTDSEVDGKAIFGEVEIGLTERLNLTVGYRYHEQTANNYDSSVAAGVASGATEPRPILLDTEFRSGDWVYGGPRGANVSSVTDEKDTGHLALTYQFTDSIMAFVGYSEGFNSGGVSSVTDSLGPNRVPYESESIENVELGVRSDLLNGRLRFNATYFNTDWDNIQLLLMALDRAPPHLPLRQAVLQNAAKGAAEGFEFELVFAATDKLRFQANLGFLDTGYNGIVVNAPGLSVDTEFSGAPEETYNFSVQYDANVGNGTLTTRVNTSYWGGYWRSPLPFFVRTRSASRETMRPAIFGC